MFALIGRLNRDGLAILLVEQNVVQSLAIAHRAYVLENGRIALSGAAAELAEHPELRKSYLGIRLSGPSQTAPPPSRSTTPIGNCSRRASR